LGSDKRQSAIVQIQTPTRSGRQQRRRRVTRSATQASLVWNDLEQIERPSQPIAQPDLAPQKIQRPPRQILGSERYALK
jgi:hypothetical protein